MFLLYNIIRTQILGELNAGITDCLSDSLQSSIDCAYCLCCGRVRLSSTAYIAASDLQLSLTYFVMSRCSAVLIATIHAAY